jgi:hypothetical protein
VSVATDGKTAATADDEAKTRDEGVTLASRDILLVGISGTTIVYSSLISNVEV